MEHWAKLSESHIFRLGELTKREIQVICYLFLKRNGSNKQCNPKRKTIASGTGLARPHVTIALAGLISKRWIDETPDGEFELFDADQIPDPSKVTKSVTVTKLVTVKKVTESVTPVTKSVKNSYQNGNGIYRNEQTREHTREQTKRARRSKQAQRTRIPDPFPLTDEMISWFTKHVPTLRIGPFAAHDDFVEYWTNRTGVGGLKTNWALTWQNGMRKLLSWQVRDDLKHGIKPGSGTDWRDVGRHTDEPTESIPRPDCIVCGNDRVVDDDPSSEYETLRHLPCPECAGQETFERMKRYNDEFRRRLANGLDLKTLRLD